MKTSDFDYALPPHLIAQTPPEVRGTSRMMVLDVGSDRIEHAHVGDLGRWLRPGDLLVLNNTRVFPARIFGVRADTGGQVELLMLEELAPDCWVAMYHAARPSKVGRWVRFGDGVMEGVIDEKLAGGQVRIRFSGRMPVREYLEAHGVMPLPPYIRRQKGDAAIGRLDRDRYQTVYAREWGAVAAPTAGLHFSSPLLDSLARQGVGRCEVTLHVGRGTFLPVKADDVESHSMEPERYAVSVEAADRIRKARREGGRVVAVGSTTVRTLETVAAEHGEVVPASGRSGLFIRPPFVFRAVDAMLTNFHLPRSTLLMMVSAFAGRDRILAAYGEAIRAEYRFYSYGDCMLLLGAGEGARR